MFAYLVRRLLWMIPTFLVILVITYGVMRFQAIPLSETLIQGRGGEAGMMKADSKALGSQMDTLLLKMRVTGRDLPALLNLRGFVGKDGALAMLQQAERRGDPAHDAEALERELELWSSGPLLVEPLAEVMRDPALQRYHAPAAVAITFCAYQPVVPSEAQRRGATWERERHGRNRFLRDQRIGIANSASGGYTVLDAQAATKAARILALVAAAPDEFDRSSRRWTAVLGQTGFVDLIGKMLTGTLYSDSRNMGAFDLIADRWAISFSYNTLAILIAWSLSVLIGIRSARRVGTLEDAMTTQTLLFFWSLPSFFVGSILVYHFCTDKGVSDQVTERAWFPNAGTNSPGHEWLSTSEWFVDWLWHAFLPLVVLCYGSFTVLSRYMRGSVLDNLDSDFARTARAKGVSEGDVVYHHVVPNSLITMITLGSGLLSALFGGSIVVEKIFSIDGLGLLLLKAASVGDAPLVIASTVISVGLLLIGILIADLLYAVADPRVRARYG